MFGTAHPAWKRWPWHALSEAATSTFLPGGRDTPGALLHVLQGSAAL